MRLYNLVDKKVLKEKLVNSDESRVTLSFYKYAHIGNPDIFRHHIYYYWEKVGVMGRIYVAKEGINGQISVPESQIDAFKVELHNIIFLQGIRMNFAIEDDGKSFYKLKIKVRDKIVADGLSDESFDVTNRGVHLDAAHFNELTDKDNTIIVDMRNHYESEVGHFENAICPDVDTFRESLPIIVDQLDEHRDKNIVMYCTGGIRCEKASAYFKHQGFEKVYQLDGGIIEYARQVEQKGLRNKFKGKNFVFDERMGERISNEIISHCHQCETLSDHHTNCANEACHLLFIQCDSCTEKYAGCCSELCWKYNQLPEETRLELRKGIYVNSIAYKKGRTSPFLTNLQIVQQVEELYNAQNKE